MLAEDSFIDLTGVKCPINFVRAKLMIDTMKPKEILKIALDNGESFESVSKSMLEEGHEIIQINKAQENSEIFVEKKS